MKRSLEASVLPRIGALETQVTRSERTRATAKSEVSFCLRDATEASVRAQARSIQALERSQQQYRDEIRELEVALAAHDQRSMAEERLDPLEHLGEDSPSPEQQRQRPRGQTRGSSSSSRGHTAIAKASTFARKPRATRTRSTAAEAAAEAASSHSKLKERFIRERERQRENLSQFRQQCERQHQQQL